MKRLLIWGAGGFGREALDIVRESRQNPYSEIAFIDDDDKLPVGTSIHGAVVKGNSTILKELEPRDFEICIAVGKPALRRKLVRIARQSGYTLATLIDASAVVRSSAVIEEGVIIGAQAFVSSDARLVAHSLINVGCVIGHDVTIGSFSVVSPGALILGGVILGEGVEVGSGASIFPGTIVGSWSKISMGSAVYKNVDDNMIVAGNPCRPMSAQEPYWYERIEAEDK